MIKSSLHVIDQNLLERLIAIVSDLNARNLSSHRRFDQLRALIPSISVLIVISIIEFLVVSVLVLVVRLFAVVVGFLSGY